MPPEEAVYPFIVLRWIVPLVIVVVLGGLVIVLKRQRSAPRSKNSSDGFRPEIGFTRLDGMASLALLLANRSKGFVWVEEIEIFLSDLSANEQVTEPLCRETLKIRQMIRPRDTVPISLAASVYKAAGEPQRRYSCVLSSVVRYRIGEKCVQHKMEAYRIRMIGLIASRARPERDFVPAPLAQDKSANVHETQTAK
jgi:hypothetical protein